MRDIVTTMVPGPERKGEEDEKGGRRMRKGEEDERPCHYWGLKKGKEDERLSLQGLKKMGGGRMKDFITTEA